MLKEVTVTCPACWEEIVLWIDLSGGSTEYAEDCPVCCRPMTVRLTVHADDSFAVDVVAESD